MAHLIINGRKLLARPITQSRNRDIIELQRQSGLKLSELRKQMEEADHLANVIVSFLAQHNAGFTPKWQELIDGTFEQLGELVLDEGDAIGESEDEAEATPTPVAGAPVEPEAAPES